MLVIVSDLHLTDGSSGSTVSPGAFVVFAERLRDLSYSASFRRGGRYRPLDGVDLLLLGDTLDMLHSCRWLQCGARPWSDVHGPLAECVQGITGDILQHNSAALQVLRGLSGEGAVRIPPANAAGQPAHTAEGQPVPVRIHYMVGNHDWFLHLPGAPYDALRAEVARHLGLANAASAPFPHDPDESEPLRDLQRRHNVVARHGDVHDPFSFEGDRNGSSLGDAIAIELIDRFTAEAATQLGDELSPALLSGLRETHYIRPLLLAPAWLEGLLRRTCHDPRSASE